MLQIPQQKLKEILVNEGLILAKNFDDLASETNRLNQRVEDALISKGIVSTEYFYNILSKYLEIELVSLSGLQIDDEVLNRISPDLARQKKVVVFKKEEDGTLDVAMEDPSDLKTIEFLEKHLKARIKPFLAKSADLEIGYAIYNKRLIENFKKVIEENIRRSLQIQEEKIEKVATEMPIVAIVDNFISYAISLAASDIHVEVLEDGVLIRFRIDGILHEVIRIPKDVQASILARIKLLSSLKIDEHYKPQDGRFRYKLGDETIDVRVSIMPTLYGEKIEMRLLPGTQKPLALSEVGMFDDMAALVKESIKKSYGMILVCGPTGSGKTTTLYSLLNILNKPEVNIVTIEDPIEYHIKYVNQTQINTVAGITFSNALRSFLRQDPNIIMVGEIRDDETAGIGVHAALTGHLLLSSLHTNDAPTAIPRLLDMKIPPFLVAAVLNIVIAQRLVRKVCLNCIESYAPSEEIISALKKQKEEIGVWGEFKAPKILFRGQGCPVCNNTGYRGRMGIFEILDIDGDLRSIINSSNFSLNNLIEKARQKGVISMFEDGIRKAELGQTTIEEVLRVIRE